jgi:dienelactone hydrolase
MDDDRTQPRCKVALVLLFALHAATSCASAEDTSSATLEVGSKFDAVDSLDCGAESKEDAAACIAGLSWQPTSFTVELQPAEAGCGDFLVRFPSPRPIGNSVYDLVSMEWFAAHDGEKICTARPIVVVHESARNMTVGRIIARGISGRGMHAFLIHLPGYGARRDAVPLTADRALPSLRQAIADVRRARDAVAALPLVDHSRIGLQGTSLGGFVTATVAGLDHGYDRVFIMLAGGDLQDVILHGQRDAIKVHAKLTAAGLSDDQIKDLTHQIEPLRLAHRIRPEFTWLFSGKFDTVVPPRCSLALAAAAHLPAAHHVEFSADHYSGIVYLPQVVEQIREEMLDVGDKNSTPAKD